MNRKVDTEKKPGPSPALGVATIEPPAHAVPEAKDAVLNITDAQRVAHRGSIVLRTSWAPELGGLDEGSGEEFRIVVLCEPLPRGTPTPECGVAVCAPDVAARPVARVREQGVAHRARRAEEALQKLREELESRAERRMRRGSPYGLTFRELTVLHLVVEGKSDKEIAVVLGISTLTASKHLANILHKMGAASRTEAGVRAVRERLLD